VIDLDTLSTDELRWIARADRAIKRKAEKQACEDSLLEFLRCAWPHMGEAGEFIPNWHHEKIATNLETMAWDGEVESLQDGDPDDRFTRSIVCNVPPRTTKSLLISVALHAWVWAQPESRWSPLCGPHVRFFCLSYGATLAEDLAVKVRRLIMGAWYQQHWGAQVEIRPDQAARSNFANTKGGERISCSIEGGLLGRGGDWQIVDDPHHLKGAESDTQRRETLEGMRSLVTRVTDPRIAARVLVMQRVHKDDSTNYAIENWGPVRHLMFPMKFDERRADPEDERDTDGELLWPEVWTEKVVEQEERELRPYGVAGQLQQAPVPKGGGIISRNWWRLWPGDYPEAATYDPICFCPLCKWHSKVPRGQVVEECPSCGSRVERHVPFPDLSYRLLSVDTAYGEKDDNSYSAATVWGIWHDKTEAPRAILMRAWRGRPRLRGVPDSPVAAERIGLVERIHMMAVGDQVDAVLIENKSRGQDLYQELEQLMREWPFQLIYTTPVVSKEVRLESCVPLFVNERVWAPDKAWAELVINEVEEQNYSHKAQHNDLSDTVAQSLRFFRDSGMLSLGDEFALETRRSMAFKGKSGRFDAGAAYEGE
jgi:phage terminase large subunit-like protein